MYHILQGELNSSLWCTEVTVSISQSPPPLPLKLARLPVGIQLSGQWEQCLDWGEQGGSLGGWPLLWIGGGVAMMKLTPLLPLWSF